MGRGNCRAQQGAGKVRAGRWLGALQVETAAGIDYVGS